MTARRTVLTTEAIHATIKRHEPEQADGAEIHGRIRPVRSRGRARVPPRRCRVDRSGRVPPHRKACFDTEIENPAFVGRPAIAVSRLIEETAVVVAEGTVRTQKQDGTTLNLVFCDVFELRDARITRLTSYLMEMPEST